MAMRDYEDMKDIVIPKEQEEMMNIICDAWEECRSLETCKECKDRPEKFMRMAMCTALKYTRKLIEAGYAKKPTADVQEVRHGKWITKYLDNFRKIECKCSECGYIGISNYDSYDDPYDFNYCPNCGALMDGKEAEAENKEVEEKK